MILLMKCISSFTAQSHYGLMENPRNNVYYGICISFGQADSGLLGNPSGHAFAQSAPHWTSQDQ